MPKKDIFEIFDKDYKKDSDFFKIVFNVIAKNEASSETEAYSLSLCTKGKSGYSFGWIQFDVKQQGPKSEAYKIIKNAINRIDDTKISKTDKGIILSELLEYQVNGESSNATIKKYIEAINQHLKADASFKNDVDNEVVKKISNCGVMIDNLLSGKNKYRKPLQQVIDYVKGSVLAKLFLIDYHNQFNVKPKGKLNRYLCGETVSDDISIDKDLEGNFVFGYDDLLRYYFNTTYSQEDFNQLKDLFRRFVNVLEIVGIDNISFSYREIFFFTDELKHIIGNHNYWFKKYDGHKTFSSKMNEILKHYIFSYGCNPVCQSSIDWGYSIVHFRDGKMMFNKKMFRYKEKNTNDWVYWKYSIKLIGYEADTSDKDWPIIYWPVMQLDYLELKKDESEYLSGSHTRKAVLTTIFGGHTEPISIDNMECSFVYKNSTSHYYINNFIYNVFQYDDTICSP